MGGTIVNPRLSFAKPGTEKNENMENWFYLTKKKQDEWVHISKYWDSEFFFIYLRKQIIKKIEFQKNYNISLLF